MEGSSVGRTSLLLYISHSQETLASVGEETKERDCLPVVPVWCHYPSSGITKCLYNLPLKGKFRSIFHSSSGRLVLSTQRSNLRRQSILGSLAIRKLAIEPYYVDFLLMLSTLNYGSVRFNLMSQ